MAPTSKAKSSPQTPKQDDSLSKIYLVAYNVAQIMGWSAIMLAICNHWVTNKSVTRVYEDVAPLLNIFQTAALLEILHCALGLVRSNVVLTAFQVFSRIFLTWGIAYSIPEIQTTVGVFMFIFAWTVTEIVRYSFYFSGLLGMVPYPLQWCRYTFFLVLYPVGVSGELLSIFASLPYVKEKKLYSVSLPNSYNVSFSYYSFLICAMCTYLPVFPQLFMHMVAQRKKVIGGASKKKE
ncbi:very-long-chain (3R)-3-hydroxyacyl-CoA dehydratase 2-like [Mizuhopecten yessoensis]|uniref:Very-long-chain (3R)-3-hydroxyacyl-CoA dehydratase n=1 Tax=Mizuhopecten yessoensis TaxID=6573 RepID=A0A210Q7K2_MIZYE|nr:very-long-chain (3R)-3-hydroxyacyl-CoA dehydratase 2-like [Mizuhopecten yessoensis]OWF44679.1 Very-long-chain (3R)-3-hydroxyacyl-[acyl-carrier protein] dehydratase 2 [Mizuhopecten yessoensis]